MTLAFPRLSVLRMPRPLRIEYPGAIYHVINRGNYRSWVFEEDGAKFSFEDCLFEACSRSGWALHAYCVMGNHFHLALETPEPNLSEGMRWLQATFASRFNRFRKVKGHLFQGRFKSVLVEDWERLAWVCHYIHLNPVRAGIVAPASASSYRFGSLHWLGKSPRQRPTPLVAEAFLEGSGGLKDTPAGRRKYLEYLVWVAEDEPRQKAMLFDRMSRGWALGTKEFKKAVLRDAAESGADVAQLGTEAKELYWEEWLTRGLEVLGKGENDAVCDAKSADWKVAVCAWLKARELVSNRWLAERLNMGTEFAVPRYVKLLRDGKRLGAGKLLGELTARAPF